MSFFWNRGGKFADTASKDQMIANLSLPILATDNFLRSRFQVFPECVHLTLTQWHEYI